MFRYLFLRVLALAIQHEASCMARSGFSSNEPYRSAGDALVDEALDFVR